MNTRAWAHGLVLSSALLTPAVVAQPYVVSPQNNGALQTTVLPGTYSVATLPDPAKNQARYAFVTDLGGGADMVLSDGTNWKHIRQGVVTAVPAAANITLTPLVSPPAIQLTPSSSLLPSISMSISTTNLYPGETFHIIVPSGVLAAAGTLGIGVGGGPVVPGLGGTWMIVMWNGTTLVKMAGGTL